MEPRYLDKCTAYALRRRNINCATFNEADLRVFKRYDYNAKAVFSAVGKGGYVLPIVREDYLGGESSVLCYCAIISINNVKKEITLYNPINDEEIVDSIDYFLNIWTDSGADCLTAFKNDPKTYFPGVLDLTAVSIPEDLEDLIELLAEHAHDSWAIERQSEGWTCGLERNDRKLETPDMVPYAQLPETEKQYDRIMARNTIKFLLLKGYKITY